ncbi:hypothetical protein GCM10009789_11640 [Kribbella sancticallisti]|uniref:Malectin domain-containing protein n=1 Tax=Kribbella sancticallisti TaxID=460087 RepID=A0ABP4NGE9_9ACTN
MVTSAGFAWSADQAKRSRGSWGYVGGTSKVTNAHIAGPRDDELFRTQRTGKKFSYVFEDAPAGTYIIRLTFAEIDHAKAGKRQFDVLLDGAPVLYDHDVQAEVGGQCGWRGAPKWRRRTSMSTQPSLPGSVRRPARRLWATVSLLLPIPIWRSIA